MKKYFAFLQLQMRIYIEHRFSIITENLRSFILMIVVVFLWGTIYHEQHSLPSFTYEQIILYYLLIVILGKIASPSIMKTMEEYIKTGYFAHLQIKPISIRMLLFIEDVVQNIANLPFTILVFLIVVGISPFLLANFHPTILQALFFILFYFFAIILNFLFYILLGTATFWTTNVSGIRNTFKNTTAILMGNLVPLTLFPSAIQTILHFLPFAYMLYIPASILIKPYSLEFLLTSLGIDIIWIGILYLINTYFWQKGLQKYEAFGN